MASPITGIKTNTPTAPLGMPASVVAGLKRGEPKELALSKGPKPVSSVRV